jgi:toxin FitB
LPLFAGRILPCNADYCRPVGRLNGQRQIAGRPLGMADGLLAAIALEHDLTLVTRNIRDYEDLGVTILNLWEAV